MEVHQTGERNAAYGAHLAAAGVCFKAWLCVRGDVNASTVGCFHSHKNNGVASRSPPPTETKANPNASEWVSPLSSAYGLL